MGYIDYYEKYLAETENDIAYCKKTGKRIVFGYTSNTDVLLTYCEKNVNALLAAYLKDKPYIKDVDVIDSMETLARFIAYFMLNGLGGEADISNYEVVDYLLLHFAHSYALGGTAAQGAAALASTGMPVLAHISDRNEKVCSMMAYQGLNTIKDGKNVPISQLQSGKPVYHIVFSFTKGDRFCIGGREYEAPFANRVILDYDMTHKDIRVDKSFMEYLDVHARDIISYNLSGYNAIINEKLAFTRLRQLAKHYKRIKERNPDCIIYFESAHYLSSRVKYIVYQEISPFINIMGMNEEELVAHTREHGVSIDKNNLEDVIRGIEVIIEQYHVNGIVMHTKDYSLYYGEALAGINLEKALTLGNLLSGTRARVGHYGTLQECRESIQKMPLSGTGMKFAKELADMHLKRTAFLVPSRYIEKPVCTIGLGDTFVAGVQFAFIR